MSKFYITKHPMMLGLIVLALSMMAWVRIFTNSWFDAQFFTVPGLSWNVVITQSMMWTMPFLGYLFLLRQLLNIPPKTDSKKEKQLISWGLFFVFLTGLSTGAHTVAQIMEYVIIAPEFAQFTQEYPEVLDLIFILDEIVGHLNFIFGTILMYYLCKLELNRDKFSMKRIDKILLLLISSFCGAILSYAYLEGGSMQVVILPLAIYLIYKLEKNRPDQSSMLSYPLNFYFLSSTIVLTVISFIWAVKFGLFVQPSTTVFGL